MSLKASITSLSNFLIFILSVVFVMIGPLADPLFGVGRSEEFRHVAWLGLAFPIVVSITGFARTESWYWAKRFILVAGLFFISIAVLLLFVCLAVFIRIKSGYSI